MTIVNCVAVIYVYTQFKSLSKTGSKYILGQWVGGWCTDRRTHIVSYVQLLLLSSCSSGTSGLFVIFSSFIFGIGATFYLMERNMAMIRCVGAAS